MDRVKKEIIKWLLQPSIQDLVDSLRLNDIYNRLALEKDASWNSTLTEFFMDLGIDPLKYIQVEIPKGMYHTLSVEGIVVPNTVKKIRESAFADCRQLKSVVISDSVTFMEAFAVSGCTHLKNVTLGKRLTTLGSNVFRNCDSLEEIYIPNNVTYIMGSAFSNCYSLKKISLPGTMTYIETGLLFSTTTPELKDVEFRGTGKYFREIMPKGVGGHYGITVHCDDEEFEV